MALTKYIKTLRSGQFTIPREFREILGLADEAWFKLSISKGKLLAEPVKSTNWGKDSVTYLARLKKIKGGWIDEKEIMKNRKEIEKSFKNLNW
jgi:bifunctional DNA-binding transcriptional regulator/antitoxin component of YhaV-PrlF toxin-antitoxin module